MVEFNDPDRLLNLAGIVIVLFFLVMGGVLTLAALSADEQDTAVERIEWNLTRINNSYAKLTHDGGVSVRTDALIITVDGRPRDVMWSDSALGTGEYGIVRIGQGTRVTLLWTQSEGERVVLDRWELGSEA